MKNIRSTYLLLALVFLGHLVFAGGTLEKKASSERELPRHEQMIAPEAQAGDVLDVQGMSDELTEEVSLTSEKTTPATKESPSAAAAHSEGQSHRALRVTKQEKKAMRQRARKNRKALRDNVRKLRDAKKDDSESSADDTELLLLVILAILLPPLAVYLYEGVIDINFWICLILTLLFWLPGIIFALIVILA